MARQLSIINNQQPANGQLSRSVIWRNEKPVAGNKANAWRGSVISARNGLSQYISWRK
jgi:hypothetical protein